MTKDDQTSDHTHAEYLLLYNNATRNIEYTKRHSWWLTYQALAAIGVLVFVERQFDPFTTALFSVPAIAIRINTLASLIAIVLTFFAVYLSYKLIEDLNIWAEGERKRLQFLINEKFTAEYRTAWQEKEQYRHLTIGKKRARYKHEWIMKSQFSIILIGEVIGLALIVL